MFNDFGLLLYLVIFFTIYSFNKVLFKNNSEDNYTQPSNNTEIPRNPEPEHQPNGGPEQDPDLDDLTKKPVPRGKR